MKFKENCTGCKEKEGCDQNRPIDLKETIDCINANTNVSCICDRSNFKNKACEVITKHKIPKAMANILA